MFILEIKAFLFRIRKLSFGVLSTSFCMDSLTLDALSCSNNNINESRRQIYCCTNIA